jgi:hypothetical protein
MTASSLFTHLPNGRATCRRTRLSHTRLAVERREQDERLARLLEGATDTPVFRMDIVFVCHEARR